MLSQTSQAITFDAFYTNSKVGATGLTVTVDVYRGATLVVTAGSATEVGGGLYTYTLASGSVTTAANYRAVFKTSGTVDQQWIPSLWVCGENWVQNCDASVATATTNIATLQTSATAIKTQTDKLTFTSAGKVDANTLQWNSITTVALPNSGKVAVTLASSDVTGNLPANVTQIAGQTASAAAGVTFPAAIGTSTYSGGAISGITGTTLPAVVPSLAQIQAGLPTDTTIQADVTASLTAQGYTSTRGAKLDNLDAAVSTRSTYAGGAVASVTAPVTAGTVTDKSGYALSATGLDSVSIADVTSDADGRSTLPKMLRSLFNRFFNSTTQTATQQIVHNDSGTATNTMTVSDNGTTATKGKSS